MYLQRQALRGAAQGARTRTACLLALTGAGWPPRAQGTCPVGRSALGAIWTARMHQNALLCHVGPQQPFGIQNTPQGLFWSHFGASGPVRCTYNDRPCGLRHRTHARVQPVSQPLQGRTDHPVCRAHAWRAGQYRGYLGRDNAPKRPTLPRGSSRSPVGSKIYHKGYFGAILRLLTRYSVPARTGLAKLQRRAHARVQPVSQPLQGRTGHPVYRAYARRAGQLWGYLVREDAPKRPTTPCRPLRALWGPKYTTRVILEPC